MLPTDYAAFEGRSIVFGAEAITERRHSNTDIAGFMDVAEARGWTVIHALSASAPPAGRVTRDAFERLTTPILAIDNPMPRQVLVAPTGAALQPDVPCRR
ncbi:MAG: M81 family metallopeptidase [Bosea sp. (in: a-proteobacteria)]